MARHDTVVRTEPSQKRVRAWFDGELVVDTSQPLLVWEIPYYPAYYLPLDDIRQDLLTADDQRRGRDRGWGEAELFDLRHGARVAADAAARYADSPVEALRHRLRFDWKAMDRWMEEDEEVIVHPRSPFTRVDVLPSSRHIRVVVNGETVADSHRAMALFETGRPVRWYLPQADIRMDLLEPTNTRTGCPYKGWASYWSVGAGGDRYEDLAWSYLRPLPESARIAEMVCIWDHHVQTYVDDELESP
jgi:uncharacterized protein (DUF427 family)